MAETGGQTMYDELVKRLKSEADFPYNDNRNLLRETADVIEKLSKTRWIRVTERLPEDGSDILAFESYCGYERIIPANYDGGVWFDCVYNRVAEHITHWMPLPKPPKEK